MTVLKRRKKRIMKILMKTKMKMILIVTMDLKYCKKINRIKKMRKKDSIFKKNYKKLLIKGMLKDRIKKISNKNCKIYK